MKRLEGLKQLEDDIFLTSSIARFNMMVTWISRSMRKIWRWTDHSWTNCATRPPRFPVTIRRARDWDDTERILAQSCWRNIWFGVECYSLMVFDGVEVPKWKNKKHILGNWRDQQQVIWGKRLHYDRRIIVVIGHGLLNIPPIFWSRQIPQNHALRRG